MTMPEIELFTKKRCPKCDETKSLWDFYERHNRPGLVEAWCKGCVATYRRSRVDDNRRACRRSYQRHAEKYRQRSRNREMKRRYGMTLEEYDELLQSQNGLCAICGGLNTESTADGERRALHLDHNHQTGRVRGLLCHKCNSVLGYFDDDIAKFRAAIVYLEKHQ